MSKQEPWNYLAHLEAVRPKAGDPFGLISFKKLRRELAGKRAGAGDPRHPVRPCLTECECERYPFGACDREPNKFWNAAALRRHGLKKKREAMGNGREITYLVPLVEVARRAA